MDRAEIQRRARERLATGELPWGHPQQTWAGPGLGHTCAVCDEVIGAGDVEIEAHSADDKFRYYHGDCYMMLRVERKRRGS